jgi:hypothetical protein
LVQGKMAAERMRKRRIPERRTEIKRWKDERSRNKWWRAYSVRKNNTGINDGVTDCEQTNGGEVNGGRTTNGGPKVTGAQGGGSLKVTG